MQRFPDVLNEVKPDVVIHCAAWTDVDAAEEPANASKVFVPSTRREPDTLHAHAKP